MNQIETGIGREESDLDNYLTFYQATQADEKKPKYANED